MQQGWKPLHICAPFPFFVPRFSVTPCAPSRPTKCKFVTKLCNKWGVPRVFPESSARSDYECTYVRTHFYSLHFLCRNKFVTAATNRNKSFDSGRKEGRNYNAAVSFKRGIIIPYSLGSGHGREDVIKIFCSDIGHKSDFVYLSSKSSPNVSQSATIIRCARPRKHTHRYFQNVLCCGQTNSRSPQLKTARVMPNQQKVCLLR